MRYMLTDELWAVMEPHVIASKRHHGGPPPKISDRLFLEALLYWARTSVPWRDLPGEFGEWDAVYNRFTTWIYSGRLKRLFESLTAEPQLDRIRTTFIDSTVVRAHLHAAGARRKKIRIGAERSAKKQGLGRSRGGFSTKIILTAADEDTVIAVDVVPGQASDSPLLEPLLDATLERAPNVDEIIAGKGFDGDAVREACLDRSVNPNIPNKRNRVRLWHFEPEPYRQRNNIERLIGKGKQFRRLATRYEKLKATYLGLIQLVFGFIRLRKTVSMLNSAYAGGENARPWRALPRQRQGGSIRRHGQGQSRPIVAMIRAREWGNSSAHEGRCSSRCGPTYFAYFAGRTAGGRRSCTG